MISAFLKRLYDVEIILQIGLAWYNKTLPLARFLSLHALSDADLMPRSDAWLMSFAVHASLGNTIVRVRRVWVK